jgi:hypothetical protein
MAFVGQSIQAEYAQQRKKLLHGVSSTACETQKNQRMGWCTVTSLVPSGKVAST